MQLSRLLVASVISTIMVIISLSNFANNARAAGYMGNLIGYSESQIAVVPARSSEETDDDNRNNRNSCELESVNLTELLVKDMRGQVITRTTMGSQVILEATVIDNCRDKGNEPSLVAFEVRNPDEVTNYIAWQYIPISSDQQLVAGSSWLAPDVPGKYEVRAFYMPCLSCRFFLNEILQYELMVVPAN